MGRFVEDTWVEKVGDEPGHYRATLSPEWEVWGPNGGYTAAIALLAMAAEAQLPRPATFHCSFLRVGRFEPIDLEVTQIKRGKRAEAYRVVMRQNGKELLEATSWWINDGASGIEHLSAQMPDVTTPEQTPTFEERVEDYADWYPYWRSVQGKPIRWSDENTPGDPICHFWMRCRDTPTLQNASLEAARMVLWMDLPPWNAVCAAHSFPLPHLAPNLDLTVQFHQFAPESEWILLDGASPIADAGLCGSNARLWSDDGRLLASGTAQLICTPNPQFEEASA